MAKRRHVHRKGPRRRLLRRKSDFYYELGKFCGLIAFVSIAIIGQAELIGEPWRHYVTVLAVIATAGWAYGMHPSSVSAVLKSYRNR
jgi:hypothetical protein